MGGGKSSFNSLLLKIWFSEHVLSFFSLTRAVFLSQFNDSSGVQRWQSAARGRDPREQGCGGCPFSLLLASLACPLPGPSLQPALLLHAQSLSHVQLFATRGLYPTRLLYPWDFLGKNTGVGCHFLLQGIFPTQGSDLCLLFGRQVLYHCATWETNLSASALPWSFFQRMVITRTPPFTTGCSRGFS